MAECTRLNFKIPMMLRLQWLLQTLLAKRLMSNM
jgi:hypothetical protein